MARKSNKNTGEKTQIAVLTFAMTGGGFALLTLVLVLFLNPRAERRVAAWQQEYKNLTELLKTTDMKNLRAQAEREKGQDINKDLRDVIEASRTQRQLPPGSLPFPRTTPLKGGLTRVEQTVDVKSAKMRNILMFIGDVRDAKKNIQVEQVTIARDTRTRGADDDTWNASVKFVDYVRQ